MPVPCPYHAHTHQAEARPHAFRPPRHAPPPSSFPPGRRRLARDVEGAQLNVLQLGDPSIVICHELLEALEGLLGGADAVMKLSKLSAGLPHFAISRSPPAAADAALLCCGLRSAGAVAPPRPAAQQSLPVARRSSGPAAVLLRSCCGPAAPAPAAPAPAAPAPAALQYEDSLDCLAVSDNAAVDAAFKNLGTCILDCAKAEAKRAKELATAVDELAAKAKEDAAKAKEDSAKAKEDAVREGTPVVAAVAEGAEDAASATRMRLEEALTARVACSVRTLQALLAAQLAAGQAGLEVARERLTEASRLLEDVDIKCNAGIVALRERGIAVAARATHDAEAQLQQAFSAFKDKVRASLARCSAADTRRRTDDTRLYDLDPPG